MLIQRNKIICFSCKNNYPCNFDLNCEVILTYYDLLIYLAHSHYKIYARKITFFFIYFKIKGILFCQLPAIFNFSIFFWGYVTTTDLRAKNHEENITKISKLHTHVNIFFVNPRQNFFNFRIFIKTYLSLELDARKHYKNFEITSKNVFFSSFISRHCFQF